MAVEAITHVYNISYIINKKNYSSFRTIKRWLKLNNGGNVTKLFLFYVFGALTSPDVMKVRFQIFMYSL